MAAVTSLSYSYLELGLPVIVATNVSEKYPKLRKHVRISNLPLKKDKHIQG